MRRYSQELGIPGGPRVARATATTKAFENGADIAEVQEWLAVPTLRRLAYTRGVRPGQRIRRFADSEGVNCQRLRARRAAILLQRQRVDFLSVLSSLVLPIINSRPVGLFTGGYRRYRGNGQAID